MDIEKILDILPHRYPFLLVDRVVEIEENRIKAYKNVSYNEPFFKGHFPEYPIMPGVLLLEGIAQTAGLMLLKDKEDNSVPLYLGIDKARFKKEVRPGDRIYYEVSLESEKAGIYKFEGSIKNDNGELCCKAVILAGLKK